MHPPPLPSLSPFVKLRLRQEGKERRERKEGKKEGMKEGKKERKGELNI